MTVVKRHTLNGANTTYLMKYKHKYVVRVKGKVHTHEWRHHDCLKYSGAMTSKSTDL